MKKIIEAFKVRIIIKELHYIFKLQPFNQSPERIKDARGKELFRYTPRIECGSLAVRKVIHFSYERVSKIATTFGGSITR